MKSFIILLSCLLCISSIIFAQNTKSCYTELRREGLRYVSRKDYPKAINSFFAARYCLDKPAKDDLDELIKNTQNEWVKALNNALAKSDSLIAYFGFTQDRAWAYKNGKFAVIDRNGKRLTDFEFENPEPFKESGYAIAQKADGFYYLIDKIGKISEPYNYFFPCNNGWYKVKKGNLYTFYDKNYKQVEGWDWYEKIENFHNNIAKVQKNGKWGCISSNGSVVTPILFDAIDFLDTNYAIVEADGKEGIINKEGNYIIPPEFEDIFSYSGDCFAKAFFKKDGKYGVFDKSFNVIVSPQFDWIQGCTNDLLGFKQNDKTGILGKNGNLIVQPEYESIFSNDKNITWLLKDNKWGYIVNTTQKFVEPQFDNYSWFSDNGIAAIVKDQKCGFINLDGQFIIPPDYEATRLLEDNFGVKINDKWGIVDSNNNFIISPQFDNLLYFSDGLAAVNKNKKWGYINKNGEIVIPFIFDHANPFEDGFARVKKENKWGIIDTTGKFVIAPQFDYLYPKNSNLISIQVGEKKGLIDIHGNIILEPHFKEIHYSEQAKIIWVRNDADKWGLSDIKGNFIILPRFDNVYYTSEEPTRVILNNRFYLVNKFGDIITIPPFDNVNPFKDGISEADKFGEQFRINAKGQLIIDETLEQQTKR